MDYNEIEQKINSYFDTKQYEKALECYEKFSEKVENVDLLNIVSVCYLEENRFKDCIKLLKGINNQIKQEILSDINSFDALFISGITSYLELKKPLMSLKLAALYLKKGGKNSVIFGKASQIKKIEIESLLKKWYYLTITAFLVFYGLDFILGLLNVEQIFPKALRLLIACYSFVFVILYYYSKFLWRLADKITLFRIHKNPTNAF